MLVVLNQGDPPIRRERQIKIMVKNKNRPPTLECRPKSLEEGETWNTTIKAVEPDEDPLSFTAKQLPQNAKTKPEEKKQALKEWRNRIGHEKAAAITTEAASRGTSMHSHLEHWLAHGVVQNKSNLVHQHSALMATAIIEEYLEPSLNEWWGSEVGLYYPQLYAGTTDLVGVYNGVPSIIDFKQTNKPKRADWIEDYYLQLVAYALAHNEVYGTNIRKGVVLMCVKPELDPQTMEPISRPQYQEFILKPEDFDYWADQWWRRLELYYLQA